ncbi:MAG TPA: BCCT family transporter, partial [Gammaproteobacteria bacterium]|nr:BCCT family transporter [Gammaproteobacteria bacterium]
MKRNKVRLYKWTGFIYVPFLFGLVYVALHYPQYLVYLGILGFVPTVLLILLALQPKSQQRFDVPNTKFGLWFFKVLFFEIALLALVFAHAISFFGAGPQFATQNISLESLYAAIAQNHWLWWSFFPWGCLTIWVVCLHYYYYEKKTGPYPHQTVQYLLKGFLEPQTKGFIETTIYSVNLICISTTLVAAILLSSYAIQVFLGLIPHTLITPITYALLGVLVLILFWWLKPNRLRHLPQQNFTLSRLSIILALSFILTLSLASMLSQWLIQHPKFSIDIAQLQCDCQKYFDSTSTENRIISALWGWCLLWIPLCGSYLVKISQGRSVREMILGINVLPAFLFLGCAFYPDLLFRNLNNIKDYVVIINASSKALLLLSLGLIAFGFCYLFTQKQTNNKMFYAGALEDYTAAGRTRLSQGCKTIGLSKFAFSFFSAVL